jgi:nitrate reductase gamma subunit
MHDFYHFITGPLAWVAFILFVGGSLYRLGSLILLAYKKEKFVFTYLSFKYSLRSIGHWLIPFGTLGWRKNPALTVATFAFHICLLLAPIFLLAHIMLLDEAWNISWWAIPDGLADFMTIVVVACCVFFLVRRLVQPEVKYVTSASDYIILAIVALPFISGFMAYHQWFAYPFWLNLHIFSGEIMLVTIPFTRLSHMLFSPITRAYMGSEFGGVRHARDW